MLGRTARQDKNGSYSIIVREEKSFKSIPEIVLDEKCKVLYEFSLNLYKLSFNNDKQGKWFGLNLAIFVDMLYCYLDQSEDLCNKEFFDDTKLNEFVKLISNKALIKVTTYEERQKEQTVIDNQQNYNYKNSINNNLKRPDTSGQPKNTVNLALQTNAQKYVNQYDSGFSKDYSDQNNSFSSEKFEKDLEENAKNELTCQNRENVNSQENQTLLFAYPNKDNKIRQSLKNSSENIFDKILQ